VQVPVNGGTGSGVAASHGGNGHNGTVAQISPIGVISVADYEERERETMITLNFKGGIEMPLRVTYDPSVLTEDTNAYMKDLQEDGDDRVLATAICEALIDWQLLGPLATVVTRYEPDPTKPGKERIVRDERGRPVRDEVILIAAGEKVPLDPEIVQHLRTAWLVQLWQKINQDAIGDKDANPNSRRRSRGRSR
jgi:hypothetical protein